MTEYHIYHILQNKQQIIEFKCLMVKYLKYFFNLQEILVSWSDADFQFIHALDTLYKESLLIML